MAKQYGDEVQGGSAFPLGNVGDVEEVVYVRHDTDQDNFGRTRYIFRRENDEEISVASCYDLDSKMQKFGPGAELRIERKEDQPTKSGGNMKIFKIQCVPGTENTGGADAASASPKSEYGVGDKVPIDQIEAVRARFKEQGLTYSILPTGEVMPF